MPKQDKKFVSKDNKQRFQRNSKNMTALETEDRELYANFNKWMIEKEFIGYKLYGLVCHIPKVYISFDAENALKFNSAFLAEEGKEAKTLLSHLDKNLKEIDEAFLDYNTPTKCTEKSKSIIENIANKLNTLDGIGPICFMAMLLGDTDVFGAGLSNTMVVNNKLFKIDPSEILLPIEQKTVNKEIQNLGHTHEAYTKYLPDMIESFQKSKFFTTHDQKYGGMPFFNHILNLLDKKQKDAGIAAIQALTDDDLKINLNWIAKSLGYKENSTFTNNIFETLQSRRDIILKLFDPENKITHTKLNNIKQTVVIRTSEHFQKTGKKIHGGNANPDVTVKVYSEKSDRKNLIAHALSSLNVFIAELNRKLLALQKDPEKKDKIKNLELALKEYKELQAELKSRVTNNREDLFYAYHQYNNITNHLEASLLKDISETGTANEVRRKFSDAFKNIAKVVNEKAQFSTIETLTKQKTAFNNPMHKFFQYNKISSKQDVPVNEEIKEGKKEIKQ